MVCAIPGEVEEGKRRHHIIGCSVSEIVSENYAIFAFGNHYCFLYSSDIAGLLWEPYPTPTPAGALNESGVHFLHFSPDFRQISRCFSETVEDSCLTLPITPIHRDCFITARINRINFATYSSAMK